MKPILLASAAAILMSGVVTLLPATAQTAAGTAAQPAANNPLLADWTGPYAGVPPFDRVRPEMFPPAFQSAIDERRREIAAIANNPARADLRQHDRGARAGRRAARAASAPCSA